MGQVITKSGSGVGEVRDCSRLGKNGKTGQFQQIYGEKYLNPLLGTHSDPFKSNY